MASLYKRARSPYWWIKYRTPLGEIRRESTGLRHDQLPDTRSALQMEAKRTLEERESAPVQGEQWPLWVPAFVDSQHPAGSYTHAIWKSRWTNLSAFLKEHKIHVPRQLQRSHAAAYIQWRSKTHPGIRVARHNTCLNDLYFMGLLMREAIARGYAVQNPFDRLGLRSHPRREKPELTEAQLELVSALIESERSHPHYEQLRHSFDIARWQGCRISETQVNPQTDVTLDFNADGQPVAGTIRFRIKRNRIHHTSLHPALFPLFIRLRKEGRTTTYPPCLDSKGHPRIADVWAVFQNRHRLKERIPGWTIHCLRVTAITRMARANVPQAKAMRFIGHASATVHRVYQRLGVGDLTDAMAALQTPSSSRPDSPSGNPAPPPETASSAGSPAHASHPPPPPGRRPAQP